MEGSPSQPQMPLPYSNSLWQFPLFLTWWALAGSLYLPSRLGIGHCFKELWLLLAGNIFRALNLGTGTIYCNSFDFPFWDKIQQELLSVIPIQWKYCKAFNLKPLIFVPLVSPPYSSVWNWRWQLTPVILGGEPGLLWIWGKPEPQIETLFEKQTQMLGPPRAPQHHVPVGFMLQDVPADTWNHGSHHILCTMFTRICILVMRLNL